MGFLPHLQGWRISGQLLWGDGKQNKVKVLGKRGARWGCSVLFGALPRVNSLPQWALSTVSCGMDFQGVRNAVRIEMHKEESVKVFNCFTARLGVLPCLAWHRTPWQESSILSTGFSHPTTESAYPIRFLKHGKSYIRRKPASYQRTNYPGGREHWHDHLLPPFLCEPQL